MRNEINRIGKGCVALLALLLSACEPQTIYTSPPLSKAQREALVKHLDRRWENIRKRPPNMGVRDLFGFALESAEADYRLDRIDGALAVAEQMQDLTDPNSYTYGNFRWYWKSEKPEDLNAVEFSMQDASLLWMRHRHRLCPDVCQRLERLITYSIEGIRRHRVSESYTNIFLMKTWNCIAIGENTNRPELAREGYAMLDSWMLYTWENGIHEYISPTYYGTDLDSLVLIARYAQNERARKQAIAALRLFWTDIAANWFEPCQRLGGAHSRDYDYLTGHGYLDYHLMYAGWLASKPEAVPIRYAVLGDWRPPAELHKLATERIPRMVRQRWGDAPGECAAHWVGKSISLGSSGATYRDMDKPLTVNLAGGPKMPMVYFIIDARNDPFGQKREPTGGGHMKAFHVLPFLMSVQREREVLLLASTTPQDPYFLRFAPEPVGLFSQLVMPREGVTLWIGDELCDITSKPGAQPVQPGQSVFLRFRDAVAGFRIVHALDLQGKPAPMELRNDGNKFGAMTLTVIHSPTKPEKGRATVALWVRVAEGLDDAGFAAFRRAFAQAPANATLDGAMLEVTAQGLLSPLRLKANLETQDRVACEGEEPGAADCLLSVDGKDLGREILKDAEPIATYRRLLECRYDAARFVLDRPIEVENAMLIIPPFEVGESSEASGGKFIWKPGEPGGKGPSGGRAVIPVRLPAAGTYYLWGRVLTPTPSDDSFFIRIRRGSSEILPISEWHTGIHPQWEWTQAELGPDKQRVLNLPQGVVLLEIICREDGAKIDQILLTANPDWKPR